MTFSSQYFAHISNEKSKTEEAIAQYQKAIENATGYLNELCVSETIFRQFSDSGTERPKASPHPRQRANREELVYQIISHATSGITTSEIVNRLRKDHGIRIGNAAVDVYRKRLVVSGRVAQEPASFIPGHKLTFYPVRNSALAA